ncbi:MAG: bifunctional phosphopantothenoylcysteine decarboxylase/phosphopantothenate--cysteine ligase CoaBC [Thermoleophilia bacterium]|nr:bifunctional phosphopantothenoylcysteine decarboxylase/phosphopantothenate--cysteine ligase CoaBC [Thermoleophilia bacterium]
MAEVVLAVTGGIAAYKAIDVMRILQRRGHGVSVLLSRSAERFVTRGTFSALSGRPVGTTLFPDDGQLDYDHLDFARRADIVLVCPATAHAMAEMAHGLAGGVIGTTLLAFDGPVVVAPAMNPRMLAHPATVANLATLEARGVRIVPVSEGLLADGDVGPGRLADPVDICDAVDAALAPGELAGVRVLVSAGGTQEPVDAVRFLGNRSSGKMGWALASEARRRGAVVTVLASNVALPREAGIAYVDAPTAADLHRETVARMPGTDVLVMAAAVADYRPAAAVQGKIDKSASDAMRLELEKTPDILTEVTAARRPGQVLVGFAAEHGEDGLQRAREKRARKGVDVLVHNDVSVPGIGFGSDDNAVTIIGPGDAETTVGPTSKAACAAAIVDVFAGLVTHT